MDLHALFVLTAEIGDDAHLGVDVPRKAGLPSHRRKAFITGFGVQYRKSTENFGLRRILRPQTRGRENCHSR
jgi:hypothetical protein